MNHIRYTLQKAIFTLAGILTILAAFATADPPLKSVIIKSDSSQFEKNASCLTVDTKFGTLDTTTYDVASCRYDNIVSLILNEESPYYIPGNFTVTVPLHIIATSKNKGGDNQFIVSAFDTTLTLNYFKDSGNFTVRKFMFGNDFWKVSVTIRDSLIKNVGWDVSKLLRIENEMRITRDYKFNCTAGTVLKDPNYFEPDWSPKEDELKIGWTDPNAGQNGYDLEWAWIDESALEEYKESGLYSDRLIFMNNASRVSLSSAVTTYYIPLLYDGTGRIFYRVRPAQDKVDGSRLEGKWTTVVNTANNTLINNYAFGGHQNNLNWQVTTSYAEEGKRKTVIQYFDGSLRSRQTVTKDNTTGTTVVAETMYDYQGRPAIQVLPAPTLSTIISFSKNFNKGISGNYVKDLYDGLLPGDVACLKPAEKMDTSTGASKYYSVNNPLKDVGMNQYIPDAKLYPFTETRYTPDATGRIAAQSGVGPDHILGSGHETRYYYGQADQEDLDPLFGTDVGYASHYFKNMVRDANGQYSVSYVDMHGRTVATALAGKNPENLQPLPSLIPRDNITKNLLDKETNVVKGRSIESVKELLVPVTGSYRFQYNLDPQTLSLFDKDNIEVCYTCMYDLEIEISNDCGNCGLPEKKPVYIRRNNISLAPLDSTCSNKPDITVDATVTLPEGSYTIRKTLTLSRQAQDMYRDSLHTRRNTIKTFESIYNEIYSAMIPLQSNCKLPCDVCKDRLGNLELFIEKFKTETQVINPSAEQVQEIENTWNKAYAACQAICDSGTSRMFGVREAMLQDMMPDLGQYAQKDSSTKKYNIFNPAGLPAAPWVSPRNPVTGNADCYSDATGQCAGMPQIAGSDIDSFISVFQESWANNLLYYHPEYYRLKLAEDPNGLKPSHDFDNKLQNIPIWNNIAATTTAPVQTGAKIIIDLLDNTPGETDIVAADPFFNIGTATGYASTMRGYVESNYKQSGSNQYSMWQLACGSVFCTGKTGSDAQNCLNSMPKRPSLFNITGCQQDWDNVWNIFRQMYLFEKEKMVYTWATNNIPVIYHVPAPPSTVQLVQLHYEPRFVDPNTLSTYPGGLLATALSTPPNAVAVSNALTAEYDSNCTALSGNWLVKLQVFKQCNAAVTDASLNTLVNELKNICKAGSDVTHPFGSSSAGPNSTTLQSGAPRSFEEAIAGFMSSYGMANSPTCNPYILSDIDPQLYTAQQPFSNPEITTKPDDCQCTQIALIKSTYQASGYNGSFSNYLAQYHGTVISQATLDTLQNLCNGTYSCSALATPIMLPPVLQCGASSQTCIECETFNRYRDSFRVQFGVSWPPVNHPDTALLPIDSAFAAYVNYKTGFTKTAFEYLAFADTCSHVSTSDTCRRLDSIAYAFVDTYYRNHLAINANTGCDTAHWVSNYGEGPLQVVPLSQVMINGEFVPKFRDSASFPSSLDYYDDVCFDSLTFEARIKSPRTGYGINPYSNHLYTYELYMYYDYTKRAVLSFDVDSTNTTLYYSRDPGGTQSLQLPYNFDDYKVLRVVAGQSQYHVYIDGVHIADFSHQAYQRLTGFVLQPYSTSLRADYIKLYDKSGQVILQENFDHDCGSMSFITREPCRPADCQTAFAAYYNQVNNTSYTFIQLNSISQQQCGKPLSVCDTTPVTTCYQLQKNLQDFRNGYGRNKRLISAASGCDTLHWASNYNGGFRQDVPLYQVMVNGAFAPKFRDSITPVSSIAYSDDVCFDSLAFEARIQSRNNGIGYNPSGGSKSSFQFNFYYDNGKKAGLLFDVYANTYLYYNENNTTTSPKLLDLVFFDYQIVKVVVGQSQYHVYINGVHVADYPHVAYQRLKGFVVQPYSTNFRADWIKIYDKTDQVILNEEFDHGCDSMSAITKEPCIGTGDCHDAFVSYYNQQNNTNYTFDQINNISLVNCGKPLSVCNIPTLPGSGPRLCGLNTPKFPQIKFPEDTCGADITDMAFNKSKEYFEYYKDSLRNVFDTAYYNKCLKAADIESFKVTYKVYEYHYTLYYYDQAGNLVQTVPPEGVHPNYDDTWLQSVAAARTGGDAIPVAHTLITQYRYNTLNQVVEQQTPDAGRSNFWYDRLGRLVVSRNAKQTATNKYSYTLYDKMGRITEVGQKPAPPSLYAPMNQDISRDTTALANWLNAGYSSTSSNNSNKEEITQTIYDEAYDAFGSSPTPITQRNLRNRVSYVQLFDAEVDRNTAAGHKAATFYTYDIHGNVDELLQDVNQEPMKSTGNRFKKIGYNYDLISGKVNSVAYQRGSKDQFFHRYTYDAENRITQVYTSTDSLYWEREAQYGYYKHGPLARTVLGQLQVQGMDYAYTLQGWMKGINSTSLQTGDDMGGDGTSYNKAAKDIYGFSLNYYDADYTPIGGTTSNPVHPFAAAPQTLAVTGQTATAGKGLYNGNISAMMVNLPRVGEPLLNAYTYDQLNRLTAMDCYYGLNTATNAWTPAYTPNYKERITYDANGNIETYLRNGTAVGNRPLAMDSLSYQYEKDYLTGRKASNRLRYVRDVVATNNYEKDIDDESEGENDAAFSANQKTSQPADNYAYDSIGNLVKDVQNKLQSVSWTVYGKIKSITKTTGAVINYTYDAAGNRITKSVTKEGVTKATVYLRDAQGNVLSVYTREGTTQHLKQAEVDLYGSSRLGMWLANRDMQSDAAQQQYEANNLTFGRGSKRYELTNHLGNVMATVSDKRIAVASSTNSSLTDHYEAAVVSANDYYPFGMQLPRADGADTTAGANAGLQSVNNYVSYCSPIEAVSNTFTVEFWVKPPWDHQIDTESTTGTDGGSGQVFALFPAYGGDEASGKAGMGVSVGTNGISVYEHAAGYLPPLLVWQGDVSGWTHVAIVYQNKTPKLYVNGVLVHTGLTSTKDFIYPSTFFPGGTYGNAVLTQLDEIRVWNVARTQAEIAANMNTEVPGNNSQLVAYWPMNENGSTVLYDVTGHGYNVSLQQNGYPISYWVAGAPAVQHISNGSYRYAFNGKEKDQDIGEDDYDYGMRIQDARLGRFLSVDPLTQKYPWNSTYAYSEDDPINYIDLDGLEQPTNTAQSTRIIPRSLLEPAKDETLIRNYRPQDFKPVTPEFDIHTYKAPPNQTTVSENVTEDQKISIARYKQLVYLGRPVVGVVVGVLIPLDANAPGNNPSNLPRYAPAPNPEPTPAPEPENNNKPRIFYVTYTKSKVMPDGTVQTYSGRSSGVYTGSVPNPAEAQAAVDGREATHTVLNGEGYGRAQLDRYSPTKAAIRGREQQLIDYNGGAQSDNGTSRNKIRGVGRKNPRRYIYDAASTAEFNGALPNNNRSDKKTP